MVGVSKFIDKSKELIKRKESIIEETKGLYTRLETSMFTGRKSTKKDVVDRIELFTTMLRNILR